MLRFGLGDLGTTGGGVCVGGVMVSLAQVLSPPGDLAESLTASVICCAAVSREGLRGDFGDVGKLLELV